MAYNYGKQNPIESISDSSSENSSSEDESRPVRPKSRRDKAHLAFQKSPTARLKSLFKSSVLPLEEDAGTSGRSDPLQPAVHGDNEVNRKNALDEDLIFPAEDTSDSDLSIPNPDIAPSGGTDEKETFDRWRGRLWPGKAIVSYVRVLTRCQPPITTIGERVRLGKSYFRYYRSSREPREESRAAISSQYDEAELEQSDVEQTTYSKQYDDHQTVSKEAISSTSRSRAANGWLDGEIATIVEETPLGHLPQACNDSRLGSVWVITVLINTVNITVADAVTSNSQGQQSDFSKSNGNSFGSENITLSGGDVVVLHSNQWSSPILGIIQPWDPDYDMKFGTTSSKFNQSSFSQHGKEVMMINLMVCVDGGDGISQESKESAANRTEQTYDSHRSGWAASGSIFAGLHISMAVLGNVMTYIRECQALLSLRMVSNRLQSAVLLHPDHSSRNSRPGSSMDQILATTKEAVSSQSYGSHNIISAPKCVPKQLWSALACSYNHSQLQSLQAIIARDPHHDHQLLSPIHLLQGPPGTGKTKTILGIASVFFAGGLPPTGRLHKGQRVIAGASIMSNHLVATSKSSSALVQANYSKSQQQNVNYLNFPNERDTRRPRVLICAPSNTAVDELVYRIVTQGLYDDEGMQRTDYVRVVRIGTPNKDEYLRKYQHKMQWRNQGRGSAPNPARNDLSPQEVTMIKVVESVCLESLVEEKRQQLSAMNSSTAISQQPASYVKTGHIFTLSSNQTRTGGTVNPGPHPNGFRAADLRRHVLEQADIVCCTLSGAGSQPILEILLRIPHFQFDAVIIDEAAQTVEPSSLIPFKFNPQIVVMVGDPCQLPPTIFSSSAKNSNYGQSLFERLQFTKKVPLSILATQYRMHPAIAAYPAMRFYNGHLFNGTIVPRGNSNAISFASRNSTEQSRALSVCKPYHEHNSGRFRPLVFHDINFGREEYDNNSSVMNLSEANYVVNLYDKLINHYAAECASDKFRIGIIVPYRGQRKLLLRLFRERYGRNFNSNHQQSCVDTEISTVDGFQGREKDIIIFSCVRAPNVRQHNRSSDGSIGFLRDWRRLNVAITRAKHALWIVGNGDWLSEKDPEWNNLISFIKQQAISEGIHGLTQYIRLMSAKGSKHFHVPLSEHLRQNPIRLTKTQLQSSGVTTTASTSSSLLDCKSNQDFVRTGKSAAVAVASAPTNPPPDTVGSELHSKGSETNTSMDCKHLVHDYNSNGNFNNTRIVVADNADEVVVHSRKRSYSGTHIRFDAADTSKSNIDKSGEEHEIQLAKPMSSPPSKKLKPTVVESLGPFILSEQDIIDLSSQDAAPSSSYSQLSSASPSTKVMNLAPAVSNPATSQQDFNVATPSERLRTFYNQQQQQQHSMDEFCAAAELYRFDSPRSFSTNGPFGDEFLTMDPPVISIISDLPPKRERALSSISLSSTSSAASDHK